MAKEFSQITPHLFVGRYQESSNIEALKELGITHILNVMDSAKYSDDSTQTRLHVPISDFGESRLIQILDKICDFIDHAASSGGRTLLHCARGQNRSPSVATAYLMKSQKMTLREAFYHVRKQRPQFAPHESYLQQLQEIEQGLFGNISLTEDDEPLSVQAIARTIAAELKSEKQ